MSEAAKKNGLVPKLRFREFSDGPNQWNVARVDEICTSFSGGTPDTTNPAFYGGDIPFIRSAEIGKQRTELTLTETGLAQSSARMISKGDVLIALYGANSGDVARAKLDGAINQAVLCLKCFSSEAFVFSSLERMQSRIVASYIQGGQGNLSGEIVRTLRLPISSPAEQRKIAECLQSLDELIAAEMEKLEALKRHKKGLLQQLFPAEGETTPRLRFPQFRDALEWQMRTLADVSIVVRGGSPRPIDEYMTDDKLGLSWLKIGDVPSGAKYIRRVKERVRKEALSKTRQINPGDLILSNSMSFGRPYLSEVTTCIHDGWLAITELASDVTSEFLFYTLSAESAQAHFRASAAGAVVQNLNADRVKTLSLALPSISEQKRISELLSAIDVASESQSERVLIISTHKAALMQQLFPSLDEIEQ